MQDKFPIKTAVRRRRKQEDFGELNPICILCGCSDLETFARVKARWLIQRLSTSLIEEHHVFGRHHDPNTVVPLCMNCHRKVTEDLQQAGVSMQPEPEPRERTALMLEALAVFFEHLVKAFRHWAETLRKSITVESSHE